MNPNVTLDEISTDEFEVLFRGRHRGSVWLNESGTWSAQDARDEGQTPGFDSKEDAAAWLV